MYAKIATDNLTSIQKFDIFKIRFQEYVHLRVGVINSSYTTNLGTLTILQSSYTDSNSLRHKYTQDV